MTHQRIAHATREPGFSQVSRSCESPCALIWDVGEARALSVMVQEVTDLEQFLTDLVECPSHLRHARR